MKKRLLVVPLLIVTSLLCAVVFIGCGNEKSKYTTYSLDYFDTATSITGYAKSEEEFNEISDEIIRQLEEYHRLFTIYDRYDNFENLCTINELKDGVHRTVTVDRRIIDMLIFSKEMYEKTNGKVNIAMGSVLSIWHDYRETGIDEPWTAELPPMEKLTEAAEHTDINDLIIDEVNCTVHITDPLMTLDVGAVAKGYAVEMIAKSLEERGVTGYVLNVGGNVRTLGDKGNGEKWLAGIENPDESSAESFAAYLNLAGESLVTSGSYQRYYVVGDKKYHHIIDPETLMPSDGYLLVSIVCKSSALGDVLSTSLFCMSLNEGQALMESIDDAEALWILSDGTKIYSDGFESYLAPSQK